MTARSASAVAKSVMAQTASDREQSDRDGALIDRARQEADIGPDSPAVSTAASPMPDPGMFGVLASSLPGYPIVRTIHSGGQGTVVQAIQKSTRRKVAIKLMRGLASEAAERVRFEREVQILGALDHPSIVGIHDSGEVAGRSYYVMDYISGEPLDRYIQEKHPSIHSIVELFVLICEAVNAAHLRGIIHRDLKPGNVRVDSEGKPHVLDFRLAKVASLVSDVSDAELMSITGQFIGSVPWAAPEQAEGTPSRIDVRTDVYALGVMLYQSITGQFPYDVRGNVHDVFEQIISATPVRPSSICRQVDSELETIALKCLAKERERRYQTAGELARDLRHYLAGEPIEAKRDSVGYLLRKQFRRYRVQAIAGLAFVLLLLAGVIASLGFWREAVRQREAARLAGIEADHARISEAQQRGLLESNRVTDESATAFMHARLLEHCAISPNCAELTVQAFLEAVARRVAEGALAETPETEAAVRVQLAGCYSAMGQCAAEQHVRAALLLRKRLFGDQHPSVWSLLGQLDSIERNCGDRP